MTQPTSPTTRFAGLDGLRAVAVILVVVYHLFPDSPLRSGFIGVDVFFVISGFLITSLLLRPSPAGRPGAPARLLDFWRRRARRLLPALAVMVTVCATAAWMIGGDLLVGIGRQVLGAATFSYNWLAVGAGTDYFAATSPELFRNVWSLAVEEQFYVLWPLLLPLVLLIPLRWARTALLLVAAGGSAWWMAALAASGDVTRAYFGTDSHAFGLLFGITLALLLDGMPQRAWMRHGGVKAMGIVLGVVGLGAVIAAAMVPETADALAFPGVLLVAAAGSVLVIAVSVFPGSWIGPALDIAPLRWVGDRSYGIYLWHWPVLVLVLAASQGSGPESGVPLAAGVLTLALTVAAAALSYRFIEMPVRRKGLRASMRAWGARFAGPSSKRFAALAAVAVTAIALGGTAAAVVNAPSQSSAEAAIHAGEEAVDDAAGATGSRSTTPTPTPTSPAPAPTPVAGSEITAIGDSVMLASAPSLYAEFPGIVVDAAVSRSIWAGPDIVDGLAASGQLRPYVVVALGTNGAVDRGVLERIAKTVGDDRHLILVNAFAPRDWIPGVNADLAAFADSHRGVWLADWSGAIAPHKDLLASDDIHPSEAGGDIFADEIAETIDRIEDARVQAEQRRLHGPDGRSPRIPFPEE